MNPGRADIRRESSRRLDFSALPLAARTRHAATSYPDRHPPPPLERRVRSEGKFRYGEFSPSTAATAPIGGVNDRPRERGWSGYLALLSISSDRQQPDPAHPAKRLPLIDGTRHRRDPEEVRDAPERVRGGVSQASRREAQTAEFTHHATNSGRSARGLCGRGWRGIAIEQYPFAHIEIESGESLVMKPLSRKITACNRTGDRPRGSPRRASADDAARSARARASAPDRPPPCGLVMISSEPSIQSGWCCAACD